MSLLGWALPGLSAALWAYDSHTVNDWPGDELDLCQVGISSRLGIGLKHGNLSVVDPCRSIENPTKIWCIPQVYPGLLARSLVLIIILPWTGIGWVQNRKILHNFHRWCYPHAPWLLKSLIYCRTSSCLLAKYMFGWSNLKLSGFKLQTSPNIGENKPW